MPFSEEIAIGRDPGREIGVGTSGSTRPAAATAPASIKERREIVMPGKVLQTDLLREPGLDLGPRGLHLRQRSLSAAGVSLRRRRLPATAPLLDRREAELARARFQRMERAVSGQQISGFNAGPRDGETLRGILEKQLDELPDQLGSADGPQCLENVVHRVHFAHIAARRRAALTRATKRGGSNGLRT